MRLVALCGRKRSGKDTIAEYLVSRYNYVHVKLATPLKGAVCTLFGLAPETVEDESKDVVHPGLGVTPRQVMQVMGTEVRDALVAKLGLPVDMLARRVMESVDPTSVQNVVVSDMRFVHEFAHFRSRVKDLVVIRVERPYVDAVDRHTSETESAAIPATFIVRNDGSLQDLYRQIDEALAMADEPPRV